MERILSAIQKAREQREHAPAAPRPPVAPAVPAAWEAIQVFAPSAKVLERHRVLTVSSCAEALPFDMMRTRILQQMKANGWRRLAITSPTAAAGKTTLVANIAFALARHEGTRTAAIELDLRRPALAETVGIDATDLQFSRVLEGQEGYAAHMRRVGDNLVFGVGRRSVRHSAELLQSETTTHALARIEKDLGLNVMLFDMPPMMAGDDVLAFISQADCALLVAAAESTTIAEIDRCERDLAEQTNVLGVVLNKCRYTQPEYGYDY